MAVVTPSFLHGDGWNVTPAKIRGSVTGNNYTSWVAYGNSPGWQIPLLTPEGTIQDVQRNASTSNVYLYKGVSDCYAAYADYWAALGNLVIVTKNQSLPTQKDDSLLIFASVIPRSDNWAKNGWAQDSPFEGPHDGITVTSWYLGPEKYEVDYCLIEPAATFALSTLPKR